VNFNYTKKDIYPKNLDIYNNIKKHSIQNKSLSCEISATSDIISTIKNKNIDENILLTQIDKSKYFNKKAKKNKE
jgi:hypothetical protein